MGAEGGGHILRELSEAEMVGEGAGAGGQRQMIARDGTWKRIPAGFIQGDGRVFDANLEPQGWREAGFDDRAWQACVEVADRWPNLVASEMPPLMEVRYPVMRIAIRPRLCDLAWARGVVPTPQGDVAVAWTRREEFLEIDVTVPEGASAELVIPSLGLANPLVRIDGRVAERAAQVLLPAGRHRIDVAPGEGNCAKA